MLRKERVTCPTCNNTVENLRSRFCSNSCQMENQYQNYIDRWLKGIENGNRGSGRNLQVTNHIKRYLERKYGAKCTRCGWNKIHPISGKVPLNIEHIDGNPFNSSEENLTLLCPNCHSLTESYGAYNKGNGRNLGAIVQREDRRLAVF